MRRDLVVVSLHAQLGVRALWHLGAQAVFGGRIIVTVHNISVLVAFIL